MASLCFHDPMDAIPFQIYLGIISGPVGNYFRAGIISGPVWRSFRGRDHFWACTVPTLWFIDLTVDIATCHIQYTILYTMPIYFTRKRTKYEDSPPLFVSYENGRRRSLGAQSINTQRTYMSDICNPCFIQTIDCFLRSENI